MNVPTDKADAKRFMTLFLSIVDDAEDADEAIAAASLAFEMEREGVTFQTPIE